MEMHKWPHFITSIRQAGKKESIAGDLFAFEPLSDGLGFVGVTPNQQLVDILAASLRLCCYPKVLIMS